MEGKSSAALIVGVVLLVAMAASTVEAQCGMSQSGFSACKESCTKTKDGSSPPSPSDVCCNAVRGANLKCLCSFANSPLITTFNIDKDAAMKLPITCKVDPNFHC